MGPLGRRGDLPDWDHLYKYPLSKLTAVRPVTHVPVAIGVDWYEGFDTPELDHGGVGTKDDVYWIGRNVPLGNVRGGHCVCLEPAPDPQIKGGEQDSPNWWEYYNQGAEGACVGFGTSRMMTLINRHRYDARWVYDEARKLDGTYPNDDGTFVRSGLEILRTKGARITHLSKGADAPKKSEGIAAYRWAANANEVLSALGTPELDYVTLLNSWGTSYPHRVRMPADVLDKLIQDGGEAGVITDR